MTPTEEHYTIHGMETSESINLKEYFDKYLINWRWFLVGVVLALFTAFVYLKIARPQYNATAYIMIKDNLKSGISDELKAVSDLGIVGTGSTNNPENEIFIIKSRKIVGRMIDSLELTTRYFSFGSIRNQEIYKNNYFKIKFLNNDSVFHYLDTSFVVSYVDKNTFQLKSIEGDLIQKVQYNQTVGIENKGKFKILPSINTHQTPLEKSDILVVIKPRDEAIDVYQSRIEVTAVDENSSVLSLSIKDPVKLKAEHILDELIEQYNRDAVIDKNIVSNKTKDFIDERLQSIGVQLAAIQDEMKEYKIEFGVSGSPKEGEIALIAASENTQKIIDLKTQLNLLQWVQEEINNNENGLDVLPANLGFTDAITSKSIGEYNNLVLEKLRLERNAGGKNPNLITLINQLKILKQNLRENFTNLEKSLEIQIAEGSKASQKVKNQVSAIPTVERGMIDIQRQKLIYGELYSYLLKKKEEIAISLAITVPNAKIIDTAYGGKLPVSPRKYIVYFIALFLGLFFPFVLLYVYHELDTKIHYRKDIEHALKIPYLGDIPQAEGDDSIVVTKEARSSTAEAFRLLRTNLNFLLPNTKNKGRASIIFVTSTISGEGKSFVSINLAATLALTNKKVLLIGLDLRAPKIARYLGMPDEKGITNYILDDHLTAADIKFQIPQMKNVDFIGSGLIPPNPSELLLHEKVKFLFEQLEKEYDYIVADTAPVSLVTDTLMIAEYADMFLYVARANHLEKRMLIVPETLYREKKLPNMAMLLNNTDSNRGYGYGYGFVEQEKKSRFRSFMRF